MLAKKLEKNVKLYRNQFDDYCYSLYQDYRLSRYSLDLDAIMFRIKYMTKHNKDIGKINEYKEEFINKAAKMRECFNEFMNSFLCDIILIPDPFHYDDIVDVFATNVKIDSSFVTFDMILISQSNNYLDYVNSRFKDGEVFNMFPDKYFRFYTDSYNDGITKAYPELFANRKQGVIGTGDDGDVFVHSLTLQTSERCSLGCTYCFGGDTFIHMANGSLKRIKNIKVGDEVVGFNEKIRMSDCVNHKKAFKDATVLNIFKHEADTIELQSPYLMFATRVTPDHKVLTSRGWMAIKDITNELIGFRINKEIVFTSNYLIFKDHFTTDVYNIETTTGTYIANGMCVHNCYQFNKSEMRMSFETAKTFIDHLLNDDYGYINRYNSPALILEFIGGEPLLEIKLTRRIYEYFLEKCYELNHPWFTMHRLSICSNGMQYFDEEVQSFFKDYASQISFNISIDGNKELHDACRIQPNKEGSYDIDICALNHFNKHYSPERNSKMTLSPQNISHLYDSVVDFIKNGMKVININCIFEEGWTPKTAHTEYEQLTKLADYILENDLENLYIAIFSDKQESRLGKEMDSTSCGGNGAMLALRPNGQFYPCLRYMPSSVGNNVRDLCMGDVNSGMLGRDEGSDILKELDSITRRSQTNDICWECPIASNCAGCLALGHTVYGTPNKRASFICIQHIAEHLACVYYFNLMNIKHPEWDLPVRKLMTPDEWNLLVLSKEELNILKAIEIQSMINKMKL